LAELSSAIVAIRDEMSGASKIDVGGGLTCMLFLFVG
jgi:hypothetical protein